MKILLVARNFAKDSGQGVDTVTYNLFRELSKTQKVEVLFGKKNSTLRWILYDFSLLFKLIGKKFDIYHSMVPYTGFAPVLIKKKKTIVTIHDLIPYHYKDMNLLSRVYYRFCSRMCRNAYRIITVSNYSKKEICKILKLPEEKVRVVYDGIDHERFFFKKKIKNKKFKIGFIGGLTKQKNPISLVKAFKILNDKNSELVIGGKGKEYNSLERYIKENQIKNIKLIGYVSEKDLVNFYRGLDLFVYPSFYEGFGLPPLEAMACGCPVISSNKCSLPEIVGKAGILINPENIQEIADNIKKVKENKKLREKMIKEGLNQAKKFGWERCAKEALNVYGEVSR